MSFCCDNAAVDLNLAAGTNELAARSALDISRFSDRSGDAELARVGQRDLNLIRSSFGTEDRHCHLASGSYNSNLFKAGELTRLRKILFVCKLGVRAEKSCKGLLGYVNVMCRGFYHNFHS